ncbi:conserved hypothetical protein [Candidatus Brocadia pituitae]|nr:conserved hypothetical protein [Candidatus Brocadia pituitae]
MKVSKDISFLITYILFTTITAMAGSFKKFITSRETLFPSNPRNRLNPFFAFTASDENTGQEYARFKRLKQWYETTIHSRYTFTTGFQ